MKNRKSRLKFISEILSCQVIGSQDELLGILLNHNYEITQATLSRDLRRLKATKVAIDGGGFRYVIFNSNAVMDDANISVSPRIAHTFEKINQDILSFAISRNLVVIKTRNGCASGLAYDIDLLNLPEVLGTIPGTDTVLLVMDEDLKRDQIIQLLMELIPNAITTDNSI